MKRKNKWYALIALAAVLFVAGTALAAGGNKEAKQATRGGGGPGMGMHSGMGGGMGMGAGGGICMAIQRLLNDSDFLAYTGISTTQTGKIETLINTSAKDAIRNRAEVQILQMELQELMDADSPAKTQIYAKIDQIGKLQTDSLKAMADMQIQARSILTSDQIDKAFEYIRQNKSTRGKGMGGNMGSGLGGGMGRGANSPALDSPEQ
jgi:Spy/CpxP family protein refolding chaperone